MVKVNIEVRPLLPSQEILEIIKENVKQFEVISASVGDNFRKIISSLGAKLVFSLGEETFFITPRKSLFAIEEEDKGETYTIIGIFTKKDEDILDNYVEYYGESTVFDKQTALDVVSIYDYTSSIIAKIYKELFMKEKPERSKRLLGQDIEYPSDTAIDDVMEQSKGKPPSGYWMRKPKKKKKKEKVAMNKFGAISDVVKKMEIEFEMNDGSEVEVELKFEGPKKEKEKKKEEEEKKNEAEGKFKEFSLNQLKEMVAKFFLENPNPNDKQVHEFAEQNNVDPHQLEEVIYDLLTSLMFDVGKHLEIPDEAFDAAQLAVGIEVELEHTDDEFVAKQIAKDHLAEIPDYYTRLLIMEDQAGVRH